MTLKRGILLILIMLSTGAKAFSFKAGDVILTSLPCYICSLIELEEDSAFSHIGIVNIESGKPVVYEARGSVKKMDLEEFVTEMKEGQIIRTLRMNDKNFNASELKFYFESFYEGANYDRDFLWDNVDSNGSEEYYCSELVYKFLKHFTDLQMKPKKMHFNKHRKVWEKFFRGNVPDNKPGLSPEDFNQSSDFLRVKDFYPNDLF